MKSFLKYVLATITGTLIVGIVLIFIFFGMVNAFFALATKEKSVEIKKQSVLVISLNRQIKDRKPSGPFINVNLRSVFPVTELGLNEILDNIKKAEKDANIEGILLDLSTIQADIATIDEIRSALKEFKDSGKFVICYSDYFTQPSYYLASVADDIYMNPEGIFFLKGFHAEINFIKGTLDKLGIQPQIIRHGKFKSAVEPLINKSMSDENRAQIKSFMGSMWNYYLKNISAERHIAPSLLNRLADNLTLSDPQAAYECGLLDSLIYRDQVMDILKEKTGTIKRKKPNLVSFTDYAKVPKPREHKGFIKEKIAVIYAQGDIVPGKGNNDEIGADVFADAISEARQDSMIKAIVLRVNSPGGSALASEIIWREIELARKSKPVIASMGDYAASGGYYIVSPADVILANQFTLTGSIGVFGIWMDAKDFFNKKLGITSDVENTNTYSDFGSVFRPFSPYETAVAQKSVDKVYDAFVNHVAAGRNMSFKDVDKIGEGRVWSGINAININLVDTFGGLTDAIKLAAKKVNLEEYRIVEYPKLENPLDVLVRELMSEAKIKMLKKELGENYKYLKLFENAQKMNGVQARMPYSIHIE